MDEPSSSGSGPARSRPVSPVSQSNEDVFGDEFAEDYAESIITPSIGDDNPFADPCDASHPSQVDLTLPPTSQPEFNDPQPHQQQQHRESIRKPRGTPEKSGISNELDPNLRSTAVYDPRRPIALRTNSTTSLAPPLSPTDGNHGPSHPYAMYPQVPGLSRTTSLATTSAHNSTPNPQGPTHPYALYPQNVFDDPSEPSDSIPVGFPGLTQHFQRRRNAEGEEQDMIGVDGHGEQLPPYTRYPEAAVLKPLTLNADPLPVIGEAEQSRDDLVEAPQTPGAVNPFDDTAATIPPQVSVPNSPSESSSLSEKSWKARSWKERRNHKVFGLIPLWMIFVIFSIIIIIVAICAGVSAGIVSKAVQKAVQANKQETTRPTGTTGLLDAKSITGATATIGPPPMGTFAIPFRGPDTRFNACLNPPEGKAWSCDLPPHENVTVSITQMDGKWYLDTIINASNQTQFTYGTQQPHLRRESLKLVLDLDAEVLGAAYHFQTFYDKLVVIPASFIIETSPQQSLFQLASGAALSDRTSFSYPPVVSGDEAWFCQWDDTFIEGFIYVAETQQSRRTSDSAAARTTPPTSTPTPTLPSISSPYSGQTTQPSSPIFISSPTPTVSSTTPPPWDIDEVVVDELFTLSLRERALGHALDARQAGSTPSGSPTLSPTSPPPALPPTTSPPPLSSGCTTSPSSSSTTTTSAVVYMPNMVKFEERRLDGLHGPPECILYYMAEDGVFTQKYNAQQQEIRLVLDEHDGANWMMKYRHRLRRRESMGLQGRNGHRDTLDETCYCQWTSFEMPAVE